MSDIPTKPILDASRSLAAILTGLRLLQIAIRIAIEEGTGIPLPESLEDILTDGDTLPIPTIAEINELCEYVAVPYTLRDFRYLAECLDCCSQAKATDIHQPEEWAEDHSGAFPAHRIVLYQLKTVKRWESP